MQFLYVFPGRWVPAVDELLTLDAHVRLCRAAAAAGFAGVAVDEHPIPDEAWRQAPGGHDALDPFVVLAAVAASAPSLKLVPYLAVVPYRNPFLLAKQATTLDLMSDGRLILGVGTGYLEGEFRALGVDFAERNRLFDEGLEVMKLAWTGEPVNYEGLHFTASEVTAWPRPVSRPHPPLWIGGNSRLTMRRVVDHAQGWMPLPNTGSRIGPGRRTALETVDDLRALTRGLAAYAAERGRTEPIDIVCSLRGFRLDTSSLTEHVTALAESGVTWVTVNGEGHTIAEAEQWIAEFGTSVIAASAPLHRHRPSCS